MIKIELELTDLDYDAMLETLLPRVSDHLRTSGNPVGMLLSNGMSTGMARKVLATLTQKQKDQLIVDMLNANKARLIQKAETMAAENGVQGRVSSLKVSAK